ncbi:MAG TPA: DHH family phosphoesterase [Candidatus Nanopelagicales bacterium]|nr:DHH family phosphoesterase [Candidatus Nanopelagicales bacterium]
MTVGADLVVLAAAVPDAIVERLRAARSVLAVGHESPDADALGAALAVALLVEARGGRATVAVSDGAPALYAFLPGVEKVRTDPEPGVVYDLVVLCDCGDLSRAGPIRERNAALFAGTPLLTIDHHASNDGSGGLAWIDPGAAATCEMLALLAVRLGIPLTAGDGDLAACLTAGIVMDTATFAHPNATPRTLRVAAALVEAGAPLSDISRRLYRTKPDAQLALFGRVLARLERHADGLVVASSMELADLVATGARSEHSEGIIDLLAQAETAEVALLLKEKGAETRLSVRTKPGGVDATVLCGTWGGGGHARAAGASLPLPLAEAKAAVLPVAERFARAVVR